MKANRRCFIVGAGDFFGFLQPPEAGDYLIAADGGYRALERLGYRPDLLIGDFDSLGQVPGDPSEPGEDGPSNMDNGNSFPVFGSREGGPSNMDNGNSFPALKPGQDGFGSHIDAGQIIRLPVRKDDTDIGAAVKIGLDKGFRDFRIYGGTGGRFAHTMANIQLLSHIAETGARAFLYGKNAVMTALKNGKLSFREGAAGYISIFSLADISRGVSISGLKYELENGILENTFSLGVSNEFLACPAHICVEEGTLLVIWEDDANRFLAT
ncbi:MAG: thiamine diphosphokinase [Lachnospiraceae bacterium]|nr:thiamine diphosphokinase [Lachnospiraceae bacterium]